MRHRAKAVVGSDPPKKVKSSAFRYRFALVYLRPPCDTNPHIFHGEFYAISDINHSTATVSENAGADCAILSEHSLISFPSVAAGQRAALHDPASCAPWMRPLASRRHRISRAGIIGCIYKSRNFDASIIRCCANNFRGLLGRKFDGKKRILGRASFGLLDILERTSAKEIFDI